MFTRAGSTIADLASTNAIVALRTALADLQQLSHLALDETRLCTFGLCALLLQKLQYLRALVLVFIVKHMDSHTVYLPSDPRLVIKFCLQDWQSGVIQTSGRELMLTLKSVKAKV